MKKHHVLYEWPIMEIRKLADSEEAETYAGTLDKSKEAEFALLTEKLRSLGTDLYAAQACSDYTTKWTELFKVLELLEERFPNFPNAAYRKFRLFCLLAEKLTAPALDLDNVEIDENFFEVREMLSPVPVCWFTKENHTSMQDSVALFTLNDLPPSEMNKPPVQRMLEQDPMSPEFVFLLLASLREAVINTEKHAVFVKKSVPPIAAEAVHSFACLSVLTTGKAIHIPKEFNNTIAVIDPDVVRAGIEYHQLNDVLNVVSEYNARKDTLSKYLSLYHVFENFMFKAPIVSLERQSGGAMFSIRDFRRLYGEIDKNELEALNKLFADVFTIEPITGTSFRDRVASRWGSFCSSTEVPNIDALLIKLRFKTKSAFIDHRTLLGNFNAKHFAQLVYFVRNVIVHNTETEWHLTHASFDDSCRLLLEEFLIPSLEEICFHLLSVSNDQVWYSHRKMALY